jgi:predicted RNA polymerase sigma factor
LEVAARYCAPVINDKKESSPRSLLLRARSIRINETGKRALREEEGKKKREKEEKKEEEETRAQRIARIKSHLREIAGIRLSFVCNPAITVDRPKANYLRFAINERFILPFLCD